MSTSGPIGIFDSGVGGLSVLHHIRRLLPAENLYYVADNGYLPYGTKEPELVIQRSLAICAFLLQQGAKAIVVACNTATAAAVRLLRERYALPIIGMEPGVKPATAQTRTGKIAILATEGTLGSAKFQDLMQRHGTGAEVLVQPCHGWVELVESQADTAKVRRTIAPQLESLIAQGIDTLVLGCTHYPFLTPAIQQLAGRGIQIIDTGPAVARQLDRRLSAATLHNPLDQPGSEHFWCSALDAHTVQLISRLWGKACKIDSLPV
jgi:glutamate racemase